MQNNKCVLIGTFVKKFKILSFLEMLKDTYKLDLNGVFIYTIESNNSEYIVTFKAKQNKEEYLKNIKYSTVLHVKNGCLFSINALNKLISSKIGENQDNSSYQVNWNEYKNSLIILTNGKLNINHINKIDDKSIFFN